MISCLDYNSWDRIYNTKSGVMELPILRISGTPDPQDFCKFCSQKHLEEILLVGSNISSRNLMETGAFFLTVFCDIDKIYYSI